MGKMKEILLKYSIFFHLNGSQNKYFMGKCLILWKKIITHDTEILFNLLPYVQIKLGAQN